MNFKLGVVRLANEDVIATSCGNLGSDWTAKSFPAISKDVLSGGLLANFDSGETYGDLTDGGGVYNYLNGEPQTNEWGLIFTEGKYYHYKPGTKPNISAYFVECTNEEHHQTNVYQ